MATPAEVLSPAASGRGWTPLRDALAPAALGAAVARGCERTGGDEAVVGSLLVRDLLVPVTRLAVAAWRDDRLVLDVSAANLGVDLGSDEPRLSLVEWRGVGPSEDDELLLDHLEGWLLDDTANLVVEALRVVVRVGARHLWGSVALAVVNTLATIGRSFPERADRDRDALLARRPDLAALVELVRTDDGAGGTITYAIRRTCCLLVKLPTGRMCGTCSLRPRGERIDACNEHFRAGR